jgi:hypothetical protein
VGSDDYVAVKVKVPVKVNVDDKVERWPDRLWSAVLSRRHLFSRCRIAR